MIGHVLLKPIVYFIVYLDIFKSDKMPEETMKHSPTENIKNWNFNNQLWSSGWNACFGAHGFDF